MEFKVGGLLFFSSLSCIIAYTPGRLFSPSSIKPSSFPPDFVGINVDIYYNTAFKWVPPPSHLLSSPFSNLLRENNREKHRWKE